MLPGYREAVCVSDTEGFAAHSEGDGGVDAGAEGGCGCLSLHPGQEVEHTPGYKQLHLHGDTLYSPQEVLQKLLIFTCAQLLQIHHIPKSYLTLKPDNQNQQTD